MKAGRPAATIYVVNAYSGVRQVNTYGSQALLTLSCFSCLLYVLLQTNIGLSNLKAQHAALGLVLRGSCANHNGNMRSRHTNHADSIADTSLLTFPNPSYACLLTPASPDEPDRLQQLEVSRQLKLSQTTLNFEWGLEEAVKITMRVHFKWGRVNQN